MQLFAEIDGFEALDNVKIIGCTNRIDILDPAITRPGRLDRLIEVPLPDIDGVNEILKVHTRGMNTARINTGNLADEMKGMSGAEIKSVCTEAGYFAIRDNRSKAKQNDFWDAIEKVKQADEEQDTKMFG